MTLTLNKIPVELTQALEAEASRLGQSLEQAAIEVLRRGLGMQAPAVASSISRFSGLWSSDEHAEFESSIAGLEAVDSERFRYDSFR